MMDVTRGAHGELVIHIDGDFDATAATRLSGWLVEVPDDDPLVIDFTRVRRCEPVGLAAVAGRLAAHERLQVRGLTRHDERMLRYLGVPLEDAAQDDAAQHDREVAG
jgi:anti-anti-sigma regulatory factor